MRPAAQEHVAGLETQVAELQQQLQALEMEKAHDQAQLAALAEFGGDCPAAMLVEPAATSQQQERHQQQQDAEQPTAGTAQARQELDHEPDPELVARVRAQHSSAERGCESARRGWPTWHQADACQHSRVTILPSSDALTTDAGLSPSPAGGRVPGAAREQLDATLARTAPPVPAAGATEGTGTTLRTPALRGSADPAAYMKMQSVTQPVVLPVHFWP